ncbi:hypothetical protein [Glycomyces albidus]|jgi:hypothetical protein|uniref:Uncharacterized protein n=1 Tax=Glycomyces albidus TaxID=2656774 RepID=A0A6L5GFK7_9ACTN|nr:hypothetical protein [Glycomyces albidus]MQM28504.1 hypothetical protein [Glycomyces albidus]
MTYPPPGGENPQYQLQPEPQQPSDPYAQGYNTPPPPTNYYQQQPGYSQPPPQYSQPGPPMGVQPGPYPTAPGSVLPPPIPPAKQGGNLGVILAVVVGLVVVLGVAAVLLIPTLTEDDEDPQAGEGDDTSTSESEEPAPSEEPSTEPTEEESTDGGDSGATLEGWGTPVSSESFDANTPEGAALTYRLASDTDDDAALQSVVCASPSDNMEFDVEWELEYDGGDYGFLLWSMSKEENGETKVWAGWTLDDLPPDSEDDLSSGYTFTAVEEDGAWKLCDVEY